MAEDYKARYLAFMVEAYTRYLALVKPMIKAVVAIDPFMSPASNPIRELFKYSLVFDDINAPPATLHEVLAFTFNQDWGNNSREGLLDCAAYFNDQSILSAIGLNNSGYGQDRYQWLIEQRKKTLGTVNYDFLEWSKNREYADKIHPLLHKVTSKESLDIIKAYLTEIQMGGFSRAFGNAEVQDQKEREVGNAFRAWWRVRESYSGTQYLDQYLRSDLAQDIG